MSSSVGCLGSDFLLLFKRPDTLAGPRCFEDGASALFKDPGMEEEAVEKFLDTRRGREGEIRRSREKEEQEGVGGRERGEMRGGKKEER